MVIEVQIRLREMEGTIDIFRDTYGTMPTSERAPVNAQLLTNSGTGRVLMPPVWEHASDLTVLEARGSISGTDCFEPVLAAPAHTEPYEVSVLPQYGGPHRRPARLRTVEHRVRQNLSMSGE